MSIEYSYFWDFDENYQKAAEYVLKIVNEKPFPCVEKDFVFDVLKDYTPLIVIAHHKVLGVRREQNLTPVGFILARPLDTSTKFRDTQIDRSLYVEAVCAARGLGPELLKNFLEYAELERIVVTLSSLDYVFGFYYKLGFRFRPLCHRDTEKRTRDPIYKELDFYAENYSKMTEDEKSHVLIRLQQLGFNTKKTEGCTPQNAHMFKKLNCWDDGYFMVRCRF